MGTTRDVDTILERGEWRGVLFRGNMEGMGGWKLIDCDDETRASTCIRFVCTLTRGERLGPQLRTHHYNEAATLLFTFSSTYPPRMPLFNLPLDSSSTRPSTRAHFYPRISKKRKRHSSPHVDFAEEIKLPAPEQSSLPAASTNPLSLTPDEIHQYKVAGLDLDQEFPSKSVPDFPHRSLPPSFPSRQHIDVEVQIDDEGAQIEGGNTQRERKAPPLRMQHLGVLTTILQRCLLEGDIPRASRAWAMLLRAQHNGKGIDIRSSGYWGIGAELLIRSGEKPARGRRAFREDNNMSSESDEEDSDTDDEAGSRDDKRYEESEWRWGTASGLEKAKDYYERLILQHPYTRQYHDSVNSLDFWPAMLSCEIYGIQFEQKEALKQLAMEEESKDVIMADVSSEEDEILRSDDPETYFAARQRKEAHQRARKRDIIWIKRDQIRHTALVAAEKIAARMDELMTTPPYSDSHVLHRLRGMLALYVGDLSVPALFEDNEEQEEDGDQDRENSNMRDAVYGKLTERRFLKRHRRAEHERGLVKCSEERTRAQKAFEKIQRNGGRIDVDITRLASADS